MNTKCLLHQNDWCATIKYFYTYLNKVKDKALSTVTVFASSERFILLSFSHSLLLSSLSYLPFLKIVLSLPPPPPSLPPSLSPSPCGISPSLVAVSMHVHSVKCLLNDDSNFMYLRQYSHIHSRDIFPYSSG